MIALRFAYSAVVAAPGRIFFLALILALATTAWITLTVLAAPFVPSRVSNSHARLTVAINSANAGQHLPLRYAKRIEKISGVAGVVYSIVLSVVCKDAAPAASIQAFGGSLSAILDLPVWPDRSPQLEALQANWISDPMAVLLGAQTATDCEWRAGMGIAPKDFFSGRPVDIHVAGILPVQEDPIANIISIGHYDYLERATDVPGGGGRLWEIIAYPRDGHDVNVLAARIEQAFAHDDPPIEASTGTTLQSGLARYGQAQYILGYVMLATFLCTALVLVSVLAHAITQRRSQMALLQVLGFWRGVLFLAFVVEGLFIVLFGSGLGVAASLLLLHVLPVDMAQFFGGFTIPAWTWWGLPIWLAVLLMAAMIVPSVIISRLAPIDVRTA